MITMACMSAKAIASHRLDAELEGVCGCHHYAHMYEKQP